MYHVITTGVISLMLYLISFSLYKSGFITGDLHRKTWNIILALAFFLILVAGLFLALQASYKWDIPYVKTILRYHVETGIILAFAGIFHFSWHLKYYFSRPALPVVIIDEELVKRVSVERAGENLVFIGFISTSVQILLLREILNISGGFELIGTTYLGVWLLASAAGAMSEKHAGRISSHGVNMLFAAGLLLTLFLVIVLNIILLSPGESPSYFETVIYLLVVLFPFCYASGYSFTRLLKINRIINKTEAGRSFALETAGGILAGVVISLLISGLINNYTLLVLLLIFTAGYLAYRSVKLSVRTRVIITLLLAVLTIIIIILPVDVFFRGLLLRGTRIVSTRDTPYGNISIGRYGNDTSIYYNHRLLRWDGNDPVAEEYIHYAMLQHPDPQSVLLISGDAAPAIRELKKYNVSSVTFIERDRELLKIIPVAAMPGLNAVAEDAYRYVRNTEERYDVIICQLPPPTTLVINRFYTLTFYNSVKRIMSPGGVYIFSPGAAENYLNRQSLILYSSLFNTARKVFDNIMPIEGQRLYFIASDSTLSSSFASLTEQRGIKNLYVNSAYLADDLIKRKSDEISSLIDRKTKENSINNPSAVFYSQSMNILRFPGETIPSLILLAIILAFPLGGVRRWNLALYFSTAALASVEVIILFVIQSTIGAMYQLSGLIIASVMAGLAVGSAIRTKSNVKNSIIIHTAALALYYLFFAIISDKILEISDPLIILPLLLCISFVPAFLTGGIFRITAGQREFSLLYAADLAGSSLGFLLISGFLLPVTGVQNTAFVISGLILTGFLFGTIARKY